MNRTLAALLVIALVPFGIAIHAGGCVSAEPLDGGESGAGDSGKPQDAGTTEDTGAECTPGQKLCDCMDGDACDDGLECQAGRCVPKSEPDAGTEDAGEADAGVQTDTGTDTGVVADAGDPDTGVTTDAGAQDAGPADAGGGGDWPPKDPWFEGKLCKLPACDSNAVESITITGSWEMKLTTVSHDCNKLLETFDPRMKPGNVATETNTYIQKGECLYADTIGGTVSGVIKGNVAIGCNIEPPQQGVTVVVTSLTTFTGSTATGEATGHLNDVPLAPAICTVEYTAALTKK